MTSLSRPWKASVVALAPKAAAISSSLTRPVMREMKVIALNTAVERSSLGPLPAPLIGPPPSRPPCHGTFG